MKSIINFQHLIQNLSIYQIDMIFERMWEVFIFYISAMLYSSNNLEMYACKTFEIIPKEKTDWQANHYFELSHFLTFEFHLFFLLFNNLTDIFTSAGIDTSLHKHVFFSCTRFIKLYISISLYRKVPEPRYIFTGNYCIWVRKGIEKFSKQVTFPKYFCSEEFLRKALWWN